MGKVPSIMALQDAFEPLKNKTYLGKELFSNFWGTNFLVPKSGRRREKQPVLGPGIGVIVQHWNDY